jgi:alpha-tubulin suppressor-like RCC1 family protein
MTARSIRSLRLAAVLCSVALWTASCSDDGDPAPDAATPDALAPDALVPDALAPDATVVPECRLPGDCTDGVFCNGEEDCANGQCEPAPQSACDDRIACTVDTCDEDGKRCRSDANDALCTNGRFCDGIETCAASGCEGGPPPGLADGVLCRNGRITSGFAHTCALLDSGPVYCWGRADLGQTGHGHKITVGDNEPASAGGALSFGTQVVVDIEAGDNHTCALLATGEVRCWGFGADGRLGYGNTATLGDDAAETPVDLPSVDVGGVVKQIAAGGSHTCALLANGTVRCWGRNANGQLGTGNTAAVGDNERPSTVNPVNVGRAVTQIAAGTNHTCALLDDGTVRCWGLATLGRLGYGNTTPIGDTEAPATVGPVDVGGAVTQIAAGGSHTCALLTTGAVRCWGFAFFGQLGYGNTLDIGGRPDRLPAAAGDVPVGGAVTEIALGESHTCARLETNAARCWGRGQSGQLGNASTGDLGDNEVLQLSDIDLGSAAVHLAAGAEHNCVLLENSDVSCWGSAGDGRLGHGDLVNIGDDEAPTSAGDVPLP